MSILDGINFWLGDLIAQIGFAFVVCLILFVVTIIIAVVEAHKDKEK